VSEPVAIGLVESLPRPGKNFTGLTTINRELMPKRLEMLKETMPNLARVGYLANPDYEVHKAQLTEMNAAARGLGLTLHVAEVRVPSEFKGSRLDHQRRLPTKRSSCCTMKAPTCGCAKGVANAPLNSEGTRTSAT